MLSISLSLAIGWSPLTLEVLNNYLLDIARLVVMYGAHAIQKIWGSWCSTYVIAVMRAKFGKVWQPFAVCGRGGVHVLSSKSASASRITCNRAAAAVTLFQAGWNVFSVVQFSRIHKLIFLCSTHSLEWVCVVSNTLELLLLTALALRQQLRLPVVNVFADIPDRNWSECFPAQNVLLFT